MALCFSGFHVVVHVLQGLAMQISVLTATTAFPSPYRFTYLNTFILTSCLAYTRPCLILKMIVAAMHKGSFQALKEICFSVSA